MIIKTDILLGNEYRKIKYSSKYSFVLAFVYSNKGNFILSGNKNSVNRSLFLLKSRGYKFFYNEVNYLTKRKKHIQVSEWKFYSFNAVIYYNIQINKYVVVSTRTTSPIIYKKIFKRMPRKWLPEFELL